LGKYLILPQVANNQSEGLFYASEADILNLTREVTAKAWHGYNQEIKGNIHNHLSTAKRIVLSNLENINVEFIKSGFDKLT
jgi:hypothetical protein